MSAIDPLRTFVQPLSLMHAWLLHNRRFVRRALVEEMKAILAFSTAVCWAPILSGCAGTQPASVLEEPYLVGTITAVSGTPLTVRIEEKPGGLDSGGAKAVARLTNQTRVTRNGEAVAASELRVGERASLWFAGPVAESYPVQGRAAAIALHLPP